MKGDDFYWGPSMPGRLLNSISPDSQEMTISVPEDKDAFEKVRSKASYHQSGQFHIKHKEIKSALVTTDILKGGASKAEIAAPARFMTLISKSLENYSLYQGNLTKRKTNAAVLDLPGDSDVSRLYLEFFLSPPGEFSTPTPLLKFTEGSSLTYMTHSMSAQLILVIFIYPMSSESELNSWQPEVELAIYGIG